MTPLMVPMMFFSLVHRWKLYPPYLMFLMNAILMTPLMFPTMDLLYDKGNCCHILEIHHTETNDEGFQK